MSIGFVLIVPFMELKIINTMSTTMSTTVLIVPFMELKTHQHDEHHDEHHES